MTVEVALEVFEIISLGVFTFFAYQAYNGLTFGVFRVNGMTNFIMSVAAALIVTWVVVRYAHTILGWFGFGLPGYAKYGADIVMILVVLGFGIWIAATRAKASGQAIFDVFIWPIVGLGGVQVAAAYIPTKFGFLGLVEAVRLAGRYF